MSTETHEAAPEAAVPAAAQAVSAMPAGAASALSGLAPQQRLALQLQGAGGNAGVARMLRASGGSTAAPGSAGAGAGGVVARTPAAAPATDAPAATEEDDSWLMAAVKAVVEELPGYDLATLIAGQDPLTGASVPRDRKALVELLLGHGPFAAGVGPVLATLDVFDQVFTVISDGLSGHNLTLSRIVKDFGDAWDEVSLLDGIDANVAIVMRYVNRLIDDVKAFAGEVADQLIEMVRAAAVKIAEPILQRPEIAPVWNLARKVMHYDPLKGESVDAPTVEILGDFMRLIGQEERLAQMQARGTLQKTADWLDTQVHTFKELLSTLKSLFADAWAAISPANLPNLLDTLPALANRALGLMRGVRDFAQEVIGTVLRLIKDALLGLLSEHAHKVPGFHLITVILGRNPFTNEAVPRTAENLIRGFISLLPGGEAIYDQLAESGVIGSAAARIEGAIDRLGISWEMVTGTFKGIWDTLGLDDLLNPIGAFIKIVDKFGEPVARIVEFVSEVVQAVVELILAAMNFPSDLLGSIIDNAKRAIADIKKDPIQFLKNVLLALKDGVSGFLSNIVGYIRDGLIGWLTHGLKKVGVELPTDWSLSNVLKLVMDVLGIGIEKLWEKLAKKTSPALVTKIRGVIGKLEGAWEWIKDVMENGIGALWKHVQDQLGNLWETLLGMAKDWIMGELIEKALTRLVSMLDPTGIMAIIRSAQAFFNAIQSAIEYLRDILAIVNDYVSTLAAVAAGNISAGAAKMEKGLAGAIPIALGFLANQVGITDVPEKIAEIIGKLRELIDGALDWLVDKAWAMGKSALSALGIGGADDEKKPDAKEGEGHEPIKAPFKDEKEQSHNVSLEGEPGKEPVLMVRSDPTPFGQIVAKLKGEVTAMADPVPGAPATPGKPDKAALLAALAKVEADAAAAALTTVAKTFWKAPTKDPGTESSLAKRINDLATQLGAITAHINPANPDGDPQVSAPGLGEMQLHGAKPSSHRTGHPLHWLESEHIVPFAMVNMLWAVAGALMNDRGESGEDRTQTTVMLYEGAARIKTPQDLTATSAFDVTVRGLLRQANTFREQGFKPEDPEYRVFAVQFVGAVSSAKNAAIARTNAAVTAEADLQVAGATKPNKQRRAPAGSAEPLTPGSGQVESAANQQLLDVANRLADAAREARNRRRSGA